jgi:hypothetical protein
MYSSCDTCTGWSDDGLVGVAICQVPLLLYYPGEGFASFVGLVCLTKLTGLVFLIWF